MGYYDNGNGNGWDERNNRSVNAVTAEIEGKLPLYKFKAMTQKELVNHICTHFYLEDEVWDTIETASKKKILSCLVTREWHHVGLFAKPVDYYEFDAEKFMEASE